MTTDFTASPLDIALRKFLLDFSLPTESQEIDRLIESFANRYCACNPGLFLSSDTAHLLAFSLIMLGTDLCELLLLLLFTAEDVLTLFSWGTILFRECE